MNKHLGYGLLMFSMVFSLSGCIKHRLLLSEHFLHFGPNEYRNEIALLDPQLIVDVRTPGEYSKGHMQGAVNVSWLAGGFAEKVEPMAASKDLPVFIYCETQHRSPYAAKQLRKRGFTNIIDLKGGFSKWRKAGLPVHND